MAPHENSPTPLASVPPEGHRAAGFIEHWQFWAPPAAVLLVVCWRVLAHSSAAVPGSGWHSPGPLAEAHAAWDARCPACHAPLTPVSAADWLGRAAGLTHAADDHCAACHAGATHHQAEKAEDRPA